MWGLGGLILIGGFVLGFVLGLIMPLEAANLITHIIMLGIGITAGIHGNQWRESNLHSRGYHTDGQLFEASNPDGALARFLNNEASVTA